LIKIWCSSVIRQEKEQPGSLGLGGFSNRCKEDLILSSQFVCFEAGSNGLGEGCPNEWPREKMVAMIGDRVPHGWASYPSRRRRGEEFQTGKMAPEPPKSPKGTELEDRGPKGGERQLTQSVAEKAEWVAEARGRRAQEGGTPFLRKRWELPCHCITVELLCEKLVGDRFVCFRARARRPLSDTLSVKRLTETGLVNFCHVLLLLPRRYYKYHVGHPTSIHYLHPQSRPITRCRLAPAPPPSRLPAPQQQRPPQRIPPRLLSC
jgi:hypothetical protein